MASRIKPLEQKPNSRCRQWELAVELGSKPAGTYKRYKRKIKDANYTEALEMLAVFAETCEADHAIKDKAVTFESYAATYTARKALSGSVSTNTAESTKTRLKQAAKWLGSMKLKDITAADINDCYVKLMQVGGISGKQLSRTTVSDIAVSISELMNEAVKESLIVKNPCLNATPPKRDTKEKRSLSSADLHLLIAFLNPTNYGEMAVLLAVAMGLRRGEIVGLSWEDVDFETNTITVRHAYTRYKELKETKTKRGFRILPMPDFVSDALAKWKSVAPESEAVIPNEYGERMRPETIDKWWLKHKHEYACELTLHELRHSYVTELARNGIHPTTMSQLAGHSADVSMEIYTHVSMDDKINAMQKVYG